MRKLLVIPALLVAFAPASASGQAVSGGQAPQNGGTINTSPYNSTNVGDQYTQRRQSDNLPEQRSTRASVSKMGPARPATASDLSVGANVNDTTGVLIAKIDEISNSGDDYDVRTRNNDGVSTPFMLVKAHELVSVMTERKTIVLYQLSEIGVDIEGHPVHSDIRAVAKE